MLLGPQAQHTHTYMGWYRKGSILMLPLRGECYIDPQQLFQLVLGHVVNQRRVQASLREHKGRKEFPGSFLYSESFPKGEEFRPLAIAVSEDTDCYVKAFLGYLLRVHVGEVTFQFHGASSAL